MGGNLSNAQQSEGCSGATGGAAGVTYAPDGSQVLVGCIFGQVATITDTGSGVLPTPALYTVCSSVTAIVASPDGRQVPLPHHETAVSATTASAITR